MRRALVVCAICGLTLVASAQALTPAADKSSMDKRSRAFTALVKTCSHGAALAINIIQVAPGDMIAASRAVNDAKSICEAERHRMAVFDTLHFRDQAVTCDIAVDYFGRGMGRLSDYIDNSKPSDITTATDYFGQAHAGYAVCFREINGRRAVYRLKPLPS